MDKICRVEFCDKPIVARGYCQGHYKRWRDGRPVDVPLQRGVSAPPDGKCTHPGCGRRYAAAGFCMTHWKRSRSGEPMDGPIRGYRAGTLLERMDYYTDRGDDCWLWTGTQDGHGYGLVWDEEAKQNRYAHVVAWELANRESAHGWVVRHEVCNTPLCVNPAHLELGTHADNVHDCLDAGRRNPEPLFRRGHLRPDEVLKIRELHSRGLNNTEIAQLFGTTRATVSRVVRKLVFADVLPEPPSGEPPIPDHYGHGREAQGASHGMSKLTEQQVLEIRGRYEQGVRQRSLAEEFGVSQGAISNIVNRKTWTHI